jgi:hypothetical protein
VAARDLEIERRSMGLTMNMYLEQIILERGKRAKKKKKQVGGAQEEQGGEEGGEEEGEGEGDE